MWPWYRAGVSNCVGLAEVALRRFMEDEDVGNNLYSVESLLMTELVEYAKENGFQSSVSCLHTYNPAFGNSCFTQRSISFGPMGLVKNSFAPASAASSLSAGES